MGRLEAALDRSGGVARALAADGHEVVVVTGARGRPWLGPLPDGVTVAAGVPLAEALAGADVLVSQGGAAGVSTGLGCGRPQVIVGQLPDHLAIGRRAEAAGAAVCLAGDATADAEVAAATRAVLDRPGYGAAARRAARDYAGLPGPGELVAPLRELAAAGRVA
jgi:UDP:flavonoid glycosyltransferase YjiC (YdhE family)